MISTQITEEQKNEAWNTVCKEFPDDPMMRDLHFLRELMWLLEKGLPFEELAQRRREIDRLLKDELKKWYKSHPGVSLRE